MMGVFFWKKIILQVRSRFNNHGQEWQYYYKACLFGQGLLYSRVLRKLQFWMAKLLFLIL